MDYITKFASIRKHSIIWCYVLIFSNIHFFIRANFFLFHKLQSIIKGNTSVLPLNLF